MKLYELATTLNDLSVQLNKATGEIIDKITSLENALVDTDLPEDVAMLLGELKTQVKALDDIVPDAPPPTPIAPPDA